MRKLSLREFQLLGFELRKVPEGLLLSFRGQELEVLSKPPWYAGAERYWGGALVAATRWVKKFAEEDSEWEGYVKKVLVDESWFDRFFDSDKLEDEEVRIDD